MTRKRRNIRWSLKEHQESYPLKRGEDRNSDVELVFTAGGIKVHGWYDSFVVIGSTVTIPWAEIDQFRLSVNQYRKEVGA